MTFLISQSSHVGLRRCIVTLGLGADSSYWPSKSISCCSDTCKDKQRLKYAVLAKNIMRPWDTTTRSAQNTRLLEHLLNTQLLIPHHPSCIDQTSDLSDVVALQTSNTPDEQPLTALDTAAVHMFKPLRRRWKYTCTLLHPTNTAMTQEGCGRTFSKSRPCCAI